MIWRIAAVWGLLCWCSAAAAAGPVTLHVRDGPVRAVLEGLARSGNVNLIIDDSVQGAVTVYVKDVSVDEALEAVAASRNLVYEKDGAVQIMRAADGKERAHRSVRAFPLAYAAPKDVQEAVKAVVPDSDVRIHDDTNSVVVNATRQEQGAVADVIAALDTAPKQVCVEVEIASVDKTALRRRGIDWEWTAVPGGPGADGGFSFAAQLQALEEDGSARILARPRMVAVNGREASVLIGDKVPVVTEHMSGGEKTATTDYEDVGVKLRYVPRIHDDGTITASVEAEVSTPVFVSELKAYRIAVRRAQTVVRMFPGKTLVLGGLIRSEDVETMRKIPILGDIPLLGKLFRSYDKSKTDTEVVIMLRAAVMGGEKDTQGKPVQDRKGTDRTGKA